MSDTPKDHEEGTSSGDAPEYRDPTGASWNEGGSQGEAAQGQGAGEVAWSAGADDTQSMPSESTQQFPSTPSYEPPSGGAPQGTQSPYAPPSAPYGQASSSQNPYGQTPSPYGQGQGQGQGESQGQGQGPYAGGPGSQPQGPVAPGTPTYPYGQQPTYGQQQPAYGQQPTYGQQQPAYGQQPYGQGSGYAPSPYARPRQTNTSAIVLLIISGLSTLGGCIFAIPAVILGIMALVKQDDSPSESAKLTRWGWIAYAIAVALVIIAIIIGIAIFASMDYNSTGY